MQICVQPYSVAFLRQLKHSEESEYSEVLKRAKSLVSKSDNGRSILIIPSSSLPQAASDNTGIGTLNSAEASDFIDFAKKYWGINEVEILPMGQYYSYDKHYPLYSCSSIDLGNHVIDLKKYLPPMDFKAVVEANTINDKVNFENIVEKDSISEKMLKKLYNNMPQELKKDFDKYKLNTSSIIERKSLYKALTHIYNSSNYQNWNEIDKNLFNDNIIMPDIRDLRIKEIQSQEHETIDFYKFKQFLAEQSLSNAKSSINSKNLKLIGDVNCNFSYDEIWSYPKAFLKNCRLNWGMAALDINSSDAEQILREKIRLAAKRYDSFRLDAAWTYLEPNIYVDGSKDPIKKDYGDKLLNIIEDEVKKVKGQNYDLKNILYEFAADTKDFDIHYHNDKLKPSVKERVKIYTSDYMDKNWGYTKNFIDRGWGKDMFVLGITNHDSPPVEVKSEQVDILSKIFNVTKDKLNDTKEFLKYKFAEPLRAQNNMLFFMQPLNIKGRYKDNKDNTLDFTIKIPENYKKMYFQALESGEGYNPMDALEKNFKSLGLDKTENELYQKIVKYRNILQEKQTSHNRKLYASVTIPAIILMGLLLYVFTRKSKN